VSEKVIHEQKAIVKYVQAGEVPLGITPVVPSGIEAPAVAMVYSQAGKRLLARYGKTAEGAYRLEYVRETGP